MSVISFVGANFFAREADYAAQSWQQGSVATDVAFKPLASFEAKFDALISDIAALGFRHTDIWLSHLNPIWVTDKHLTIARRVLASYDMQVTSLCGWFGSRLEEVEASCRIAKALGTDLLGGTSSVFETGREAFCELIKDHNLRFGLENHPEKRAEEILAKVERLEPEHFGITFDTGWAGTASFSAPEAIKILRDHLFYIHLKDVRGPGMSKEIGIHETCRFGEGVVAVKDCVTVLKQIAYKGAIGIEHQPRDFDPSDDIWSNYQELKGWLS